ncbi:IDI1 [Auxenochlorella protothecoides x Auxenochlorella symbiontica]
MLRSLGCNPLRGHKIVPFYPNAGFRHWRSSCEALQTASRQSFASWTGNASQDELMIKDECILVDESDAVTGHASKYDSHRFVDGQPHGLLHRAFSVFLFDDQDRLLLQQRAASKITFPEVWTNTCCSHPLHGYSPTEVDTPKDVASGQVPGTKRAARRKLEHELGIPPHQIPLERLQYLTRLHYCAGDTDVSGKPTGWGEQEMDYILFIRAQVDLKPNPEEVMDTRYVTQAELAEMMDPASGLRWSPWFRIIATHFLPGWWHGLEAACSGSGGHQDLASIHRLG